jgi:Contractile injection system tube protein
MEILNQQPPKCFLINLVNNDRWEAPFNPQSLEESLRVNYRRIQVPGLSHERLQYRNTGNKTIPLEFFISQMAQDAQFGTELDNILADKAWLESLAYPAADIDFGYVGTPRVLFVWPTVIRLVGRITSFSTMHRQFQVESLTTTMLVARLDFEEDRDMRILMNEVKEHGAEHYRDRLPDETEEGGA